MNCGCPLELSGANQSQLDSLPIVGLRVEESSVHDVKRGKNLHTRIKHHETHLAGDPGLEKHRMARSSMLRSTVSEAKQYGMVREEDFLPLGFIYESRRFQGQRILLLLRLLFFLSPPFLTKSASRGTEASCQELLLGGWGGVGWCGVVWCVWQRVGVNGGSVAVGGQVGRCGWVGGWVWCVGVCGVCGGCGVWCVWCVWCGVVCVGWGGGEGRGVSQMEKVRVATQMRTEHALDSMGGTGCQCHHAAQRATLYLAAQASDTRETSIG